MLDDAILGDFMTGFYGYGDYRASVWFIGMEEGGGNSLDEMSARLSRWDGRSRHELEDARAYHLAIGIPRFFRPPAALQNTWKQLIRVYLSLKGLPSGLDDIRSFQMNQLGRHGGDTALLELMPLPSPGKNLWRYPDWSLIPSLFSRDTYYRRLMPARQRHLRERIIQHRPPFVVFYGQTYSPHYEQVAGGAFIKDVDSGFLTRQDNNTLFVIIQHPAAIGARNAYYHQTGTYLRSRKSPG